MSFSKLFEDNKAGLPYVLGGIAAGALLGYGATQVKKKPSKITLKYFNGRGLAEISRTLFAMAGAPYEDYRYNIDRVDGNFVKPEMDKDAAAGLFDANMARLPVLEVDGVQIGTSKAIQRYIATTYGMMGSNALEAAKIDGICECVGDISDAFGKENDKDKWFENLGRAQGDRYLPYYLEQLNKMVGDNGYSVGNKFSLADAVIYNKFAEKCTTKGLFGSPVSEPMGNEEKMKKALATYAPKVGKIAENFRSAPAMQEYLKKRPMNNF